MPCQEAVRWTARLNLGHSLPVTARPERVTSRLHAVLMVEGGVMATHQQPRALPSDALSALVRPCARAITASPNGAPPPPLLPPRRTVSGVCVRRPSWPVVVLQQSPSRRVALSGRRASLRLHRPRCTPAAAAAQLTASPLWPLPVGIHCRDGLVRRTLAAFAPRSPRCRVRHQGGDLHRRSPGVAPPLPQTTVVFTAAALTPTHASRTFAVVPSLEITPLPPPRPTPAPPTVLQWKTLTSVGPRPNLAPPTSPYPTASDASALCRLSSATLRRPLAPPVVGCAKKVAAARPACRATLCSDPAGC